MINFIFLVIVLICNLTAHAAVQTDNHTYIVSSTKAKILVIDRKTGEEKTIPVGGYPHPMVIHGDFGYVSNLVLRTVSLLDLKTNTLKETLPVGKDPRPMVIHGDFGYVSNFSSGTVSVLDLKVNTIKETIPVEIFPKTIVIHGDFGYVSNESSRTVSVLDLKTNTIKETIHVEISPSPMVIHGDFGYVSNFGSGTVSVLDLKVNNIKETLPVGRHPQTMVIHGDVGYVVNYYSDNVSVIDLKTNTLKETLPVGKDPRPMVIYGDFGYVSNEGSRTVSILDLQNHIAVQTIPCKGGEIDFSDTHVYFGIEKDRPLYPTLDSLQRMKEQKRLDEFVTMNPDAFNVGEVKPRDYPKEKNQFDELPVYVLAQEIFWDVGTDKPIIDPVDILATLATMQFPQKFLQSKPLGPWLRSRLHMAFFQQVWLNQTEKAQTMLKYFIQLEDPVISEIAPYANLNKKKVQVSGQNKKAKKSDGMSSLSSDYNNDIENKDAMQEDHPSTSSNSTSK